MSIDPIAAALSFVVFVFSVVVHENAHGFVANYFGDPTALKMGRITMNPIPHIDPIGSIVFPLLGAFGPMPMIGWAKPVPVNPANLRNPVVHNAYVAAAGPASNLLLALAASILWIVVALVVKHSEMESGGRTLEFVRLLCYRLIQINCILAVFNLLPIPPLDGHWILMRFLPPGPREALASVGQFGFLILLVLLWTGLLWTVIRIPLFFLMGMYQSFINAVVSFL